MFSTHKSLFSLTGAAVLMFVGVGAQAATYYVDVNAGSDSNPGTQALPLRTIQKSIAIATFGSTINVAPGTYHESLTWKEKYLLIHGAGAGLSIIDPSATNGGPGGRCLYTEDVPAVCGISGFTFQFGSSVAYGGGMYNKSSQPTVSNCAFLRNSATRGGGMYNEPMLQYGSSNPAVTSCTFSGNMAAESGGGMFNSGSSPDVENCAFSGNTADSGGGMTNMNSSSPTVKTCTFLGNKAPGGGGMYNRGSSSPDVENCTFTNNVGYLGAGMYNANVMILNDLGVLVPEANSGCNPLVNSCYFDSNQAKSGGGIYNTGSSPDVNKCIFLHNSAFKGGGMVNNNGLPTVTLCDFSGNTAVWGGGVANTGSGGAYSISNLALINCTFTNNTASSGGGMFNSGSSPTVGNCVFDSNTASDHGGGMLNANGSRPSLGNCTLTRNVSAYQGGGISNASALLFQSNPLPIVPWYDPSQDNPVVKDTLNTSVLVNCILWANTAPSGPGADAHMSAYNSDIQDVLPDELPGARNINADPLFMDPSNLRLKPGSPCINAGNNALLISERCLAYLDGILLDLDLNPRLYGSQVDMGAYEQSLSDVSGQVSVTKGTVQMGSVQGTFTQTVTLKNTGPTIIVGPISLILLNLQGHALTNATLTNASGTTRSFSPLSSPYIKLPGNSLAPGAVVTLTLQFTYQPGTASLAYSTKVIAGPAHP